MTQNTTEGWRERLKKHSTLHNGNCYCELDDECNGKLESFIEGLLAAQHAQFMEVLDSVVPKEVIVFASGDKQEGVELGHNSCRNEVLKRIEAAKKKITGSGITKEGK